MMPENHPYPSNFLALLSGGVAYVGAHIYGAIVEPPAWWQLVPIIAAAIAAIGPIVVQRMKERYDGRLVRVLSRNVQLEAENEALRERLDRAPEGPDYST